MSDPSQQPVRLAELMQLVSACREGVATDGELARLSSTLETNLDARQAFVELMHLENALSYHLRGASHGVPPAVSTSGGRVLAESITSVDLRESLTSVCSLKGGDAPLTKGGAPITRFALAATLATCFMLAGWILGRQTRPEPSAQRIDIVQPVPAPVPADRHDSLPLAAEIVAYSSGSRWGLMNLAVMPGGTSLRPGQPVQLQSGTAKIRFANGGVVVLQGPAVLEVESGDSGFLRSGRATLITSEGRGAVELTTPSSRAFVRNAEMGVFVDETNGTADVSALAGSIEVALLNNIGMEVRRETLIEGFAGRFQASRLEMASIEYDEHSFIREVPETYIAYQNLLGCPGDQHFEGALGMDFVVKDPIEITRLGVFDSDGDGLRRDLTAELWSRNEAGSAYRFDDDFGGQVLAREKFTVEDPGELIASNRFKALKRPLRLEPGAYTIVAYGYGEGEPNGNEGERFRMSLEELDQQSYRNSLAFKSLDDGRGAILFVGSARFETTVGVFPGIVDPGSVNRYRAGTFEFRRAPPQKVRSASQDFSI